MQLKQQNKSLPYSSSSSSSEEGTGVLSLEDVFVGEAILEGTSRATRTGLVAGGDTLVTLSSLVASSGGGGVTHTDRV